MTEGLRPTTRRASLKQVVNEAPLVTWLLVLLAAVLPILAIVVALGPRKLDPPTYFIDTSGVPRLSNMIATFALFAAVSSARIFMTTALYVGSNRPVRPIREMQIAVAMSAPAGFLDHGPMFLLELVLVVALSIEYIQRRNAIRIQGVQPEKKPGQFTALKVAGWVIGGMPVLIGIMFFPFVFLPVAFSMVAWSLNPHGTFLGGSRMLNAHVQPFSANKPAAMQSVNTGPSDAWQQLTVKEYKAWQAAGEPNLRPWDEAGRPDFTTWLAQNS